MAFFEAWCYCLAHGMMERRIIGMSKIPHLSGLVLKEISNLFDLKFENFVLPRIAGSSMGRDSLHL